MLLLSGSVLLALLLAESLVRWVRPQQLIELRADIWQPHDGLGVVMAPNLDTQINLGERAVRLRTDARGHRIDIETRPAPSYEILALGDSFLAALQVESSEIFTSLLARRLSTALSTPIGIVNTAVGSWGPSHYLLEMRQELEQHDYAAVLVAVFLGNDIEGVRRDRFPPQQSSVRHRFYVPTKRSGAAWKNGVLYPINDWLEERSHLFILTRTSAWQLLMRMGLSARRFPTACLAAETESDRWRITAEILRDIHLEAEARTAPALFVLIPGAYQIDERLGLRYAANLGIPKSAIDLHQPSRLLLAQEAMVGLRIVDATEPFRQAFADGVGPLFGSVDTHLAPGGHALLTELLEEPLLELLDEGPILQRTR